jgi:hypothetical protein
VEEMRVMEKREGEREEEGEGEGEGDEWLGSDEEKERNHFERIVNDFETWTLTGRWGDEPRGRRRREQRRQRQRQRQRCE